MLRDFLHSFVRLLLKILARVTLVGEKNIPAEGGCILAMNHINLLDAPLAFAVVQRKDVTALVADKYKKNLLLRPLVNAVGGIWINREEVDMRALREARNFLASGGVLGIAPEGTRSPTGALQPGKTGVAYLADKAGVPILPVAVTGTEKIMPQLLRMHRPAIKFQFGEPFQLQPIERSERELGLQRNTEEIMCRIAALLPPAYRGVYADHPRVQELLENRESQILIRD